jgi:hypothetical protein
MFVSTTGDGTVTEESVYTDEQTDEQVVDIP